MARIGSYWTQGLVWLIFTFGQTVCAEESAPSPAPPQDGALAPGPPAKTELEPVVVTGHKSLETVQQKNKNLDDLRDEVLLPKIGTTEFTIDAENLKALPQGTNTPIDKVLLQAPGVSYDSAISNPSFHIRNEYSNVQYRINGIQLPDGVSALGPVLETGFIGRLNLLDGTLPAQYGLRTAGVVDITTQSDVTPGGSVSIYGGSQATFSPSLQYGASVGQTQYFLTGRYLASQEGLENAMPTTAPLHDETRQEKFFGYASTLLDDHDRLTYMAGAFVGHFQIPDVAGETPLGDFGSDHLSSTRLNENETDRFVFGLVALQTHHDNLDTQTAIFTRYASTDFMPDVFDDLVFNDVASRVARKSLLGGMQFDAADRLNESHVLRAGFGLSIEQTQVDDLSTVLPLGANGNPVPAPFAVDDLRSKEGSNVGAYLQDEWLLRAGLTLNMGVRFDAMEQFVLAHQFSPRVVLVDQPVEGTTLHAGVSRYFTPPMQAQATPNNLALFQNTVQEPAIAQNDPVRPERATYFDLGWDQKISAVLSAGLDLYYKRSTDTLDDGQFGQAVVLDQFNYAQGISRGAELKVNFVQGGLRLYANLAAQTSLVKSVVSNQYLIGDPVELAFLANNYTYASDAQSRTGSVGASYHRGNLLASVDGLFGSGLRAGFANEQHSPGYAQWNAALAYDFHPGQEAKPLTVRGSVINLFDRSYLLRAGTGVGEFAPQYGPRRGVFVELAQRF
jgi:hypothetical protein